MFNKYAEYEKRRRTYLACRGVLRIKQADAISDAVNAANDSGDRMADIYNKNVWFDRMAQAAGIAGRRAGHHVGTDLRGAGREAGKGFEAIGKGIGDSFEHNGQAIEGFGERIGDYLGKGVRGAGEGIRQGVNYLTNGAYEVGRGALGGLRNAGAGLVRGIDNVGTGMSNGMDNWLTDMVQHPGAHLSGLGLGAGLGFGGYHAGNALAKKFGLDDKSWGAKALKWGLAGLGGLGGYWAGTGIGKGFGKHFARGKAPVDPRDEVPYKPNGGNNMSVEEMRVLGLNPDGSPAGVVLNGDPTKMRQQLEQRPTGLKDANGKLVAGSAGKPFGRVNGRHRRFGRAGT